MEQTFMKERRVLPLVVSMSLPMVLSMAVNSLYNIVDSYFVAKVSEEAMTALALVFPVQNLINAIAIGFAIGINACVAYYSGAGEQGLANEAASRGMLLNFLHGVLLTVVCIAGMPFFLRMFSSDAEVVGMALAYSRRAFLFSVMITLGVSFEKIFQAAGQMRVSMFCMICGFGVNMLLDPVMIFGLGPCPAMGIAGAAYATGIGQAVSFAAYLLFYVFRPIPIRLEWSWLRAGARFGETKDSGETGGVLVKKLYAVGISASLTMALPSLLVSALNGILAGFSQSYVLVLGVYYKLQTFIYLTANGIIQGIRPLMGYNYGAGEKKRVKSIYRTALILTMSVMLVGTLCSWLAPKQLIGLFTVNVQTIEKGVLALRVISLGFVVSAVSVTSSGALEGLGMGRPSLLISLLRYVLVMIPASFLLSRAFGAAGVFWAFPLTEWVTAACAYVIFRRAASDQNS